MIGKKNKYEQMLNLGELQEPSPIMGIMVSFRQTIMHVIHTYIYKLKSFLIVLFGVE